jgi:hypothetical protein
MTRFEPTPIADELQETRDALRQLVEEIRAICRTPYPTHDSGPLCSAVVALRDMAEALAERHELDADAYPAEAASMAEQWSHAAAQERD